MPNRRNVISVLAASFAAPALAQPGRTPFAALLVPLSGPNAAIGRSMERAARLVPLDTGAGPLTVIDTNVGGPEAAARRALASGAQTWLGPLTAGELSPVAAVASGRARIIAFTNDDEAPTQAANLFGVTASQTVSAILAYARARGVRRLGVAAGPDRAARQVAAAAQRYAAGAGLTVVAPSAEAGWGAAAWSGGLPDAVLYADASVEAAASARALRAAGVQALGLPGVAAISTAEVAAFEGAWLCAPDPSTMAAFDRRYDPNGAEPPGLLAALAYDAASVARAVAGGAALERPSGFTGAVGTTRFGANGRCARELTILAVQDNRLRVIDRRWGG